MTDDRFIDLDGARFHYLDWGGQGEPLLLLAGLGCTAHVYGELAPLLTDRFRVVALTRRGHGASVPFATDDAVPEGAEDARRFLDALGIERAHVVGHSMGGREVSVLAARHPDRVDRIAYLDGAYDWAALPVPDSDEPTGPDTFPSFEEYADFVYALFAEDLRGPAFDAMLRASVDVAADGSVTDKHSDAAMAPYVRALRGFRHPYDEIAAPALAIYALDDQWVEPELTWRAECRDRFRAEMVAGRAMEVRGSHYLFIDRRDEVLSALLKFLG